MSRFTSPHTIRQVPPYRPPTARPDTTLLWRNTPAPAMRAEGDAAAEGEKAEHRPPAEGPRRAEVTYTPPCTRPMLWDEDEDQAPPPTEPPRNWRESAEIEVDGRTFKLMTVAGPGTERAGNLTAYEMRDPAGDGRRPEFRVNDYEWTGPTCGCKGLPHADCPHIRALIAAGSITPPDETSWTIAVAGAEGGGR